MNFFCKIHQLLLFLQKNYYNYLILFFFGSIPEAIKAVPNSKLNWLEWLLEKGDTPIIIGYRYSASDKGRTGGGIMKPGGAFRIPPQFSGTEEENFVIRALVGEPQQQEIERIIRKALNV